MVRILKGGAAAQAVMLAVILSLTAAASSRADDSVSEGMQGCVTIEAPTKRLACYDELARRTVPAKEAPKPPSAGLDPEPSPAPVAAQVLQQAVVAAPAPEPVPATVKTLDDLDAETMPKSAREEEKDLTVRAKVTRCEKDARKKYYFVFDNGQVWKQSSDKRLTYRECAFEVTITKDFFGYKMQPDGEKGRIRIARVK